MSGADPREQVILDVVTDLLQTEGYDAVQVRRIAALASVSLTTIYRRFATREALIVRAVRRWMEANSFVALPEPDPELSAYENIRPIARAMLEPWRQHPMMLRVFVRAALGPGGEELRQVSIDWVAPRVQHELESYDDGFFDDLRMVMEHVVWSAFTRYTAGEMDLDDIDATLDRTLLRLLGGSPPTGVPPRS